METRYWAWDLLGIFLHALIFSIIVIFLPDADILRIAFGIPVLIFFPGYIVTILLFPRKYIEIEEKQVEKKKKIKRSPFFKPNTNEKKPVNEGEGKTTTKGIDSITRISLSIGLSLGIVPVIGVLLNSLYTVNEEIFGLRLYTILISLYIFIMGFGFLAFIRREIIPQEERHYIRIKIGPFTDGTLKDRIITSILVAALIASSLTGFYLYRYYHDENERFTELFLLGPDQKIADYPDLMYINDMKSVFIGIRNHEFEKMNYTLNIYLDDRFGESVEIEDFYDLQLSTNIIFTYNIELEHDDEFLQSCIFNISNSGLYTLYFVLLIDEDIYREVKLQLKVFEEEDLILTENGDISYYITGISGLPSRFRKAIEFGEPFEVGIGLISTINESFRVNFTIRSGEPDTWNQINISSDDLQLNSSTGHYLNFDLLNFGVEIPLDLWLRRGEWTIRFSVTLQGVETLSIEKTVLVY